MGVVEVEEWRVSAKSAPTNQQTSLPLTLFDIPWLLFPPSKPIFFFFFKMSNNNMKNIVLRLRESLSEAVSEFYHLAGTLNLPPCPHTHIPSIICSPQDSLSFSLARSDSDTAHLEDSLVPELENNAVMAVRVTLFGQIGFSLGIALHHVAADARTFNNFIALWSSFCNTNTNKSHYCLHYDRSTLFLDHSHLRSQLLNQLLNQHYYSLNNNNNKSSQHIVTPRLRASFAVTPGDMDTLKTWIQAHSPNPSLYLSPYVLTCALLWVCHVKAQHQVGIVAPHDHPNYFGFIAGGLTRLGYWVPPGYVGNCVGFGRAQAPRSHLLGGHALVVAATSIAKAIKTLDNSLLGEAHNWITQWDNLLNSSEHVTVVGSPKVELYATDFGFGRPTKIQDLEIDSTTNSVSLTQTRDVKGGIDLELVLPKPQLEAFTTLFNYHLKTLSSSP